MNSLKKHLYDKAGNFKLKIFNSPLFVFGFVAKIYAATFFASDVYGKFFIPFLKFFSAAQLSPYTFFFGRGMLEVFPYPKAMLYIMSIPAFVFGQHDYTSVFTTTNFDLLLYRLPILAADITILLVLARWLKGKEKQILIFYWLSPVLFYINYMHGQLDVIPMALVFAFLYFLFKERWTLSALLLGIAVAAKFHIIILIPFTIIYLWRKSNSIKQVAEFVGVIGLIFLVINGGELFSHAFQQLVFHNDAQQKAFDLKVHFDATHVIYLLPFAYLATFLHSLNFRFFNRDVFVMFLGFSLGVLILLIPPMQGWYYWVLPFLIYFYIKNAHFPKTYFWLLNIAYFAYFLIIPSSDIPHILQYTIPAVGSLPNLSMLLSSYGVNVTLLSDMAFVTLQTVLLANVIWIYKRGVEESKKDKLYNTPYLIGIAGDSGSGKSTLTLLLEQIFGTRDLAVVMGDDMHKWERGDAMWKQYTHLHPKANKLHSNLEHALTLKNGGSIHRRHYDHNTGKFTLPHKLESKKVIAFEGLHSLYLTQMRKAFDLKIFIAPEEQLRIHWKVRRDIEHRGYSKEKILEQIESRAKDSKDYIDVQGQYADIVISLMGKEDLGSRIGENIDPDTKLSIRCDNALNIEPLVDLLSAKIDVNLEFDEDTQTLECSGELESTEVAELAQKLVPEIFDITAHDTKWSSGINGVIQLFVCYYIIQSLARPSYE